ncbi:MAG: hypothetical protein CMN28_16395 [Salinisphaeraceae bacterium]|nr:hypothetical protein [Salinisphaeraceae bacterium]
MHLAQMIFRNEALYGDQPAFDFHDRRWSWRETAGRVRRLAAATRGLGLQTNDAVAVLSLNNTVYCESWFGLPLAGLRIVPLNIRLAVPEWQYLLTNSDSRALLFDEGMQAGVEALRDADVPVEHYLFIGDPAQCPDWATSIESLMQAAEPFNEELTADQSLLGIMYTGGTTGLPKGVMLRHSALYLNAMACREHIHVPADGVQLLAAPLFHIAGFTSMTLSVMSGARTVIHESFDPKRVIADCGRHAATNLTLVPAMIQLTFDHPDIRTTQIYTHVLGNRFAGVRSPLG